MNIKILSKQTKNLDRKEDLEGQASTSTFLISNSTHYASKISIETVDKQKITTRGSSFTDSPSGLEKAESTASEVDNVTPILSREEVKKTLQKLERKHDMSSEEFYKQWTNGNMPSSIEMLKWAALWEAWRNRYLI